VLALDQDSQVAGDFPLVHANANFRQFAASHGLPLRTDSSVSSQLCGELLADVVKTGEELRAPNSRR